MVADLIDQTVVRFPRFAEQQIDVNPLEKGGSDRNFYRIRVGADALILAKYGNQRDENRHYVHIARFLRGLGVRVPEIYFHDETEGLIWMEDLGDRDLWSYREEPWEKRRPLYCTTLDEVLTMHLDGLHTAVENPPKLQPEFNAELYLWEQNYFLENCLGRHFGLDADALARDGCRERLAEIAAFLGEQPRALIHRDFQSQNIVVKDGVPCLIDFQGMRPGLVQYDLASLLYDPYVELTAYEQKWLLDYYAMQSRAHGAEVPANFAEVYDLCAMQRLMQALGAYGFLGHVRERAHFLAHIPVAMARLSSVVARIPGLEPLSARLQALGSNQ
jgi:aminoglycoside/choline kinase family phosphotransferase